MDKNDTLVSLPIAIACKISESIFENELPTGTKLPSETQLAEKYDVSRPTIREAMKTLKAQNIVVIRQGDGTYVGNTTALAEDPLKLRYVDPARLAQNIFEVRLLVEPQIAMLAAERATPEETEELRKITEKMEKIDYMHPKRSDLDVQFHNLLAKCSHNAVFNQLMPVIYETIEKGYIILLNSKDSHNRAQQMHREIYEAIANKESFRARSAVEAHIYSSMNDIKYSQK